MKHHTIMLLCAALLTTSCATAPQELTEARSTYAKAADSSATEHAPTELREARLALSAAEASFDDVGNEPKTVTLAYIATRKAQRAVVVSDIFVMSQEKDTKDALLLSQNKEARLSLASRLDAKSDLAAMTNQQLQEERAKLREAEKGLAKSELTEEELAAERLRLTEMSAKLDAERAARLRLEGELAKTRAELEKVASIKEEPTRMVITLNGSVLFETGKYEVRAASTHRLDQVAEVLLAERGASITVFGHTDSEGSERANQTLSENRATSVRNYLVGHGIAADRITSKGLGEGTPVASNRTATGRANNRRVEIIVDRKPAAAL